MTKPETVTARWGYRRTGNDLLWFDMSASPACIFAKTVVFDERDVERVELAIAAVNACFEINPANPSAVAPEIVPASGLLREYHDGHRTMNLQDWSERVAALLQRIQSTGGGDG